MTAAVTAGRFIRALALSILLFPVGLATHEVAHLAVFSALGVPVTLVVTSWKLGTIGVPIWGLHAAPTAPISLDALVLNNGVGPLVAAALLLVLWAALDRRSKAARTALLANVLALTFFAAIEVAYPLLEAVARVDADFLLLPEFNYGMVLLILAATAALATASGRPSRAQPDSTRRPTGGRQDEPLPSSP
jgi:hypothetical protein